ncbi:MAG: tRNA (guanine37-N1)-methyltransferase [Gammaproteobacteria bacterium]|nr:MAG: tRNA (guanine37-N1)-methyltransferase [Gammaproteobacteria bacterium]TND03238.1 MAG: tRNA (guanine37-N1)-methyltransferase [Gammaproteobacteria bacterium]
MRIDVVTLFPPMFDAVMKFGVTGRATDRGLLTLKCWDPRDYTHDRHRTVDDRPYGGGPGMVMRVEPLRAAIRAARKDAGGSTVIYLTPQGRRLDQEGVNRLAAQPGLVLVAGRYEGIDERVVATEIDEEWSIGDYVLTGGELAAMVVIDALVRTIPGALGHDQSASQDSFATGLLDYPHYTRPEEIDGLRVPEVLLSGDHAAIGAWREKEMLANTWRKRPDLLEHAALTEGQRALLNEFIRQETGQD